MDLCAHAVKLASIIRVREEEDLAAQRAHRRPCAAAAGQHDVAEEGCGGGIVVRAQVVRRVELGRGEHLGTGAPACRRTQHAGTVGRWHRCCLRQQAPSFYCIASSVGGSAICTSRHSPWAVDLAWRLLFNPCQADTRCGDHGHLGGSTCNEHVYQGKRGGHLHRFDSRHNVRDGGIDTSGEARWQHRRICLCNDIMCHWSSQ